MTSRIAGVPSEQDDVLRVCVFETCQLLLAKPDECSTLVAETLVRLKDSSLLYVLTPPLCLSPLSFLLNIDPGLFQSKASPNASLPLCTTLTARRRTAITTAPLRWVTSSVDCAARCYAGTRKRKPSNPSSTLPPGGARSTGALTPMPAQRDSSTSCRSCTPTWRSTTQRVSTTCCRTFARNSYAGSCPSEFHIFKTLPFIIWSVVTCLCFRFVERRARHFLTSSGRFTARSCVSVTSTVRRFTMSWRKFAHASIAQKRKLPSCACTNRPSKATKPQVSGSTVKLTFSYYVCLIFAQ